MFHYFLVFSRPFQDVCYCRVNSDSLRSSICMFGIKLIPFKDGAQTTLFQTELGTSIKKPLAPAVLTEYYYSAISIRL
jgi:hypothetical protein